MAFDFPSSPTEGQLYTPVGGPTYQYVAPKWVSVGSGGGASITISDTAPSSPGAGALWWESDTGRLMVYYNDGTSSQWVEMLAGGSNATLPVQGYRNRIINGDFSIDQRYNGASQGITATGFIFDRWQFVLTAPGTLSAARYNLPGGEYGGLFSVITADASLAAGDMYLFGQRIEGINVRNLGWGTASAKPITISFDVSCTVAGTFPLSITNNGATRAYLTSFTTLGGGAWNSIKLTIPGATDGTWEIDNLTGINLFIGLGVGTTFQGVAGWQSSQKYSLPGMTNFMGAVSNQFLFMNFQLEVGTQATEFERVPYDQQLLRCQRYYEGFGLALFMLTRVDTAVQMGTSWFYKVRKRAAPTIVINADAGITSYAISVDGVQFLSQDTNTYKQVNSGTASAEL